MSVAVVSNPTVVNNYLGLLKGLSLSDKINLVAGLVNEIATVTEEKKRDDKKDVADRFFGAFQSDKSAEEMIDEIRASRTFNRTVKPF
ncbi:hypothetical protein AGMMS4957_01690 [Bacteroidia bacterium]|nr:hypothetical protein AGMMS4957_01690 [Bacteroidia bacterium]